MVGLICSVARHNSDFRKDAKMVFFTNSGTIRKRGFVCKCDNGYLFFNTRKECITYLEKN